MPMVSGGGCGVHRQQWMTREVTVYQIHQTGEATNASYRISFNFSSGQDSQKQRQIGKNWSTALSWQIIRQLWRRNRSCRRPFCLEEVQMATFSLHVLSFFGCSKVKSTTAEPSELLLKRFQIVVLPTIWPGGVSERGGLSGRRGEHNT